MRGTEKCVCMHACVHTTHIHVIMQKMCVRVKVEREGENGRFSSSLTGYEERYSGAGRSDCSQQG